jgi:hypothetical protein
MESLLLWFAARRHREIVGVAALFLVLALAATWPLVSAPAAHSVSDRANNDVFLVQYLIFWGAHAAVEDPTGLYHTNMFYPSRYAFAYADMLLTDSLLLAPVIWAFYDPTLAYNVLLWMAVVIGGTGMYVLARRLALGRPAALVAGVVFVANPTHFVRYRQLQFFNDGLLPWFLVALIAWLASCGLGREARETAPRATTQRSLLLAAGAAVLFAQRDLRSPRGQRSRGVLQRSPAEAPPRHGADQANRGRAGGDGVDRRGSTGTAVLSVLRGRGLPSWPANLGRVADREFGDARRVAHHHFALLSLARCRDGLAQRLLHGKARRWE